MKSVQFWAHEAQSPYDITVTNSYQILAWSQFDELSRTYYYLSTGRYDIYPKWQEHIWIDRTHPRMVLRREWMANGRTYSISGIEVEDDELSL